MEPLIIKPKNSNQDSTKTKKDLEQLASPADIGASISRVKQVSYGCVIVHWEDKQPLFFNDLKNVFEDLAIYCVFEWY